MYHALVYFGEDVYRGNQFFLHILSSSLTSYSELIDFASGLVSKYTDEPLRFRYVGVEELPVDAGEGYFLFKGGESVELRRRLACLMRRLAPSVEVGGA